MSIEKRKIGYWSLEFESGDDHYFDADIFSRFMDYLKGLDDKQLLSRDTRNNKAISIETIYEQTIQGIHMYKIIFKSCKYNHSPDYMSSVDGSDRETDKKLTEGDKELTHLCCRIDEEEAYTIFEQRRSGVSMGAAIRYLNVHLKKFILQSQDLKDNFHLWANIIPPEDFRTALDKTMKISVAEIFINSKVLGTGYLNIMQEDNNSQEDLVMVLKSKPRLSLAKRTALSAYNAITSGEVRTSRVRIHGKDINKMDVTIDSLHGKKVDEVTVQLLDNGIVNSSSLFGKMEELLGVTNE